MCGLAGFLDTKRQLPETEYAAVLHSMAKALRHRGPDDEGSWSDGGPGIGLAHRRLSIQDLSPLGRQPMISADGRWVIVFNGEIYNFLELRNDLVQRGRELRGGSDTEVLLELLAETDLPSTLKACHGMFALAVWDRRERVLHLARDRMGEKPLYYGWCDRTFLFGSELKAVRRHPHCAPTISRDSLALYLRTNCIPSPHTIYNEFSKLGPGEILTLNPAASEPETITKYWDPNHHWENDSELRSAPAETADRLLAILQRCIEQQMISDVPVGAFLSGGIDSSLIVALMQQQASRPVMTFTVGFEEAEFNEARYALQVAQKLQTDHTELVVTSAQARDVIPELANIYDEPFADSSQIPSVLISRLARTRVTVALSGDGGDELFGGYDRYRQVSRRWARLTRVPARVRRLWGGLLGSVPSHPTDEVARLLRPLLPRLLRKTDFGAKVRQYGAEWSAPNIAGLYGQAVSFWPHAETIVLGAKKVPTLDDELASSAIQAHDELRWMMRRDARTYLPDDILTKVDRAAMSASLETRVPFLDHSVVEFAWRVPTSVHRHDGRGKWLTRQLLSRFLPVESFDRKKVGFAIPLATWLRDPLRDWAESLLDGQRLHEQGFFNRETVTARWKAHLAGEEGHDLALWSVLMFQAWLEGSQSPQESRSEAA